MRGRKPTPTGLLRTRGTFRPDRHGMRQDAEGDLYAAPTGLTPAQRANWRYAIAHAPKGVLKKIDRGILKIWVEAEDRHFIAMQMQAKLDVNSELKLLVRGQFGLEPSPYNKILKETAQTMFRAAQELGFSPTARPRLSAEPPLPTRDPDDPWTQLRLVPGGRQGDPG